MVEAKALFVFSLFYIIALKQGEVSSTSGDGQGQNYRVLQEYIRLDSLSKSCHAKIVFSEEEALNQE